jgi:hypothetical protein
MVIGPTLFRPSRPDMQGSTTPRVHARDRSRDCPRRRRAASDSALLVDRDSAGIPHQSQGQLAITCSWLQFRARGSRQFGRLDAEIWHFGIQFAHLRRLALVAAQ